MPLLRPDHDRPTMVRYQVVAATFVAAFLLYLHRFCMSYAQRYIKEDLGLNDDQLGYCFAAFFVAYALAQVPSGWLSDRFGARLMLTLYILIWSFFTATMGLTIGFVMLLLVRLAAGLGQAGAYPTSAGLISKWVPYSGRGKASSLVAIGGRVGGGLAPILTATLIVWFVSLDVSNELNSDDLLDTHYLCFRMADAREPANPADRVARSLFEQLSAEGQQAARKLSAAYVQKRIGKVSRQGDSQANSVEYVSAKSLGLEMPSDQTVAPIVRDLNRIVSDPSGFELGDFRDIPIEREAKRLIKRLIATGLPLSSSNSDRLLGEAPRLNRLLLEAVCPNSIKKIYVKGWRPVMFVFGALGLLVASLFWFVVRDRPSRHPRCSPAEVALIDSGRPAGVPAPGGPVKAVPMKQMLKSRSLWLVCFNQFLGNIGWVFLVSWLPRYLFEVHHVPLEQRALMAAIPLWVGWCGMLLGGWLTDRVVRQFGLRWRMSPIIVGRFLGASAYLSCLLQPSAWAATIAFAVVAFSSDLGNPSSWAYKQDVGGPHVGSILGWPNMWGNLGAALCLVLHPVIVRQFGWDAAFVMCACAFLISGIAVLGVDARIPIVPKDEE